MILAYTTSFCFSYFTRVFLADLLLVIDNTIFKEVFVINSELVCCDNLEWLLYSPIKFPQLAQKICNLFLILCVLYSKYEEYSLLSNQSDRLYFFMLVINGKIKLK